MPHITDYSCSPCSSGGPKAILYTDMGQWATDKNFECVRYLSSHQYEKKPYKKKYAVEAFGISHHFRRFYYLLYLQALIDRREEQNHGLLASVTLW